MGWLEDTLGKAYTGANHEHSVALALLHSTLDNLGIFCVYVW